MEVTEIKAANPQPNLLAHPDQFVRRHIGPNANETAEMLAQLASKIWMNLSPPPFLKKSGSINN
ncbi:MAG: hypothetical protein WDM76_09140 [Limisphaerales bacterium]